MPTDLERAIAALPPTVRDAMTSAFFEQARQAKARGDRPAADLWAQVGALLLGGRLEQAVQRLGPAGRHVFARSMAETRDHTVGGPSGWPQLGAVPTEAASVAAVFAELAALLSEVSAHEREVLARAEQDCALP